MNKLKKAVSLFTALVMILSMSAFFASAAPTITKLEITKLPDKLIFYKDTDWGYGTWSPSGEGDEEVKWTWTESTKISFLRNAGSGIYPERGMVDMTGLEILVTYSDSTTKKMVYKETKNSAGIIKANILVSPKGNFTVGTNTFEVYLSANTKVYDSYKVEITEDKAPAARQKGDVNYDGKINAEDALLLLMHAVGEKEIEKANLPFADMNGDGKYNSTDALHILNISVGLAK